MEPSYIAQLPDVVPSPSVFSDKLKCLKDAFTKRKLKHVLDIANRLSSDDNMPADEILCAVGEQISNVQQQSDGAIAAFSDMDEVKLLSVALDRLTRWNRDGLLAIGDAAHAMSPIGGGVMPISMLTTMMMPKSKVRMARHCRQNLQDLELCLKLLSPQANLRA